MSSFSEHLRTIEDRLERRFTLYEISLAEIFYRCGKAEQLKTVNYDIRKIRDYLIRNYLRKKTKDEM